jgi:2'-5' RNA ligase
MAYAITLLFNADLNKAIGSCWRRLADAGLSRSMLDLGYQPHVTLAIYDTLDVDAAVASLDLVFSEARPIDAELSNVATFGAGSGVCYATQALSADLMRLHARTLGAIGGTCRPHYQSGHWTPHCTLATDLSDPALIHVIDFLGRDWRPSAGTFERAELVQFTPVIALKRWTFRPVRPATRMP